jgi:hypothetical protein
MIAKVLIFNKCNKAGACSPGNLVQGSKPVSVAEYNAMDVKER